MMADIPYLYAHQLVHAYRCGELTPVEVALATLERAHSLEPSLSAFQLIDDEATLAAARASAVRWASGEPWGRLDGVPVSIEDIVLTKGWPTLCGSKVVDASGRWDEDCPAVGSLRAAGCVLFGKTTTPEFGWKGMTDSPLRGVTRNPWNLQRTPGAPPAGRPRPSRRGLGRLPSARMAGALFGYLRAIVGCMASSPRSDASRTIPPRAHSPTSQPAARSPAV